MLYVGYIPIKLEKEYFPHKKQLCQCNGASLKKSLKYGVCRAPGLGNENVSTCWEGDPPQTPRGQKLLGSGPFQTLYLFAVRSYILTAFVVNSKKSIFLHSVTFSSQRLTPRKGSWKLQCVAHPSEARSTGDSLDWSLVPGGGAVLWEWRPSPVGCDGTSREVVSESRYIVGLSAGVQRI